MKTVAFGATNRGKLREQNEDCFAIEPEAGLYVVCDGLGGHAAGEVASRTAVDVVVGYLAEQASMLEEARTRDGGRFAVQVLVDEAINAASHRLCRMASSDSRYAGMATTITLALLWNDRLVVGHVGDCRLYVLRGGELRRLTSDHTMAAELVRRGELDVDEVEESPLSHALTRTVGGQPAVLVDTLCLDAMPGDTYLACTDGLYRYFDDAELAERLTRCEPSEAPAALTSLALDRGGADNITAIVIRVVDEGGEAAAATEAATVQRRLDALSSVPFFRDLSLRHLMLVLEGMESRRYAPGDLVLGRGEPLDGMHVLVDGDVAGLGAARGDCIGERDLTRAEEAGADLRARASSEVLCLTDAALRRLVLRHPVLGTRLFWNLLTRGGDGSPG